MTLSADLKFSDIKYRKSSLPNFLYCFFFLVGKTGSRRIYLSETFLFLTWPFLYLMVPALTHYLYCSACSSKVQLIRRTWSSTGQISTSCEIRAGFVLVALQF